jgi:hypothetical protein
LDSPRHKIGVLKCNRPDLCPLLKSFLATRKVKCDSIAASFSKPPILSERFASSSTFQYYHLSGVDQYIGVHLLNRLCEGELFRLHDCKNQIQELENASHIDVDFDAISHALIFIAFWNPNRPQIMPTQRDKRQIKKLGSADSIEVGVLQSEKATEPEELSMGGYLTVIGEQDRPSMIRLLLYLGAELTITELTLFSFPSRHHPLPPGRQTSFRASFQQPTGLHPKFEIALPTPGLNPPKDNCGLHAYWTLPSTLFIDRYQLSDPLFLASQNLVALRSLSGEQDLEAPEWVVQSWGSAALLELAVPSSVQSGDEWKISIPTHLRYLNGANHDLGAPDRTTVDIPWPVLFWACEAEEGLKMSTNPFDRVNVGYDGLFGPKTMFYHIPAAPNVGSTVSQLKVPILDAQKGDWIQAGTLGAVVLGFGFICWQLLQATIFGRSENTTKNHKDL